MKIEELQRIVQIAVKCHNGLNDALSNSDKVSSPEEVLFISGQKDGVTMMTIAFLHDLCRQLGQEAEMVINDKKYTIGGKDIKVEDATETTDDGDTL